MTTRSSASRDPVYSEADVADMRERWELAEKERSFVKELAEIRGFFTALPTQIEAIAKRVVFEVLADQQRISQERNTRRWTRADIITGMIQMVIAGLLAYLAFRH